MGRCEIVETVDMARAAALLAANPGGAAVTPELWIDRYQRASLVRGRTEGTRELGPDTGRRGDRASAEWVT